MWFRLLPHEMAHTLSYRGRVAEDNSEDPSREGFAEGYLRVTRGIFREWVVTSPLYEGSFKFVKSALALCSPRVATKLPLAFLEPSKDRGAWLVENLPILGVMLQR